MPDLLIDDVKTLLDQDLGDKRILEQILRAAENKEVISNFERNYVKKLAEKYLGRKPLTEKKPSPPDVILPEKSLVQKTQSTQPTLKESEPVVTRSKTNKMALGIGGVAFVIIVIAVVFSGITEFSPEDNAPASTNQPSIPASGILLQTDLSSYNKGDIISISGQSDPSYGSELELSLVNKDGKLVWSENVKVKSDGRYSTLVIAGGDGWVSGALTLTALHGSNEESVTFSFNE